MSMRSPLGRVRGLGTAKEGTAHWWAQCMTSLALVPLTLWFIVSLVALTGADHATVVEWIGSPLVAGLLILLIVTTFYHGALGLQIIIEDYVHIPPVKFAALIAVNGLSIVLGLTGVLAVLTVLFRG
ncbi:MAG TPA: succinate dehydrogenase, hydrophobic membrane anchor protein [Kiloniellales bacterium]|nr:succinate dehydrogenase, hydrophobic membrane anchor protein [Kiloniellales bacterium]